MNNRVQLFEESLTLLKSLIKISSFSRDEGETADLIAQFLIKNKLSRIVKEIIFGFIIKIIPLSNLLSY